MDKILSLLFWIFIVFLLIYKFVCNNIIEISEKKSFSDIKKNFSDTNGTKITKIIVVKNFNSYDANYYEKKIDNELKRLFEPSSYYNYDDCFKQFKYNRKNSMKKIEHYGRSLKDAIEVYELQRKLTSQEFGSVKNIIKDVNLSNIVEKKENLKEKWENINKEIKDIKKFFCTIKIESEMLFSKWDEIAKSIHNKDTREEEVARVKKRKIEYEKILDIADTKIKDLDKAIILGEDVVKVLECRIAESAIILRINDDLESILLSANNILENIKGVTHAGMELIKNF